MYIFFNNPLDVSILCKGNYIRVVSVEKHTNENRLKS